MFLFTYNFAKPYKRGFTTVASIGERNAIATECKTGRKKSCYCNRMSHGPKNFLVIATEWKTGRKSFSTCYNRPKIWNSIQFLVLQRAECHSGRKFSFFHCFPTNLYCITVASSRKYKITYNFSVVTGRMLFRPKIYFHLILLQNLVWNCYIRPKILYSHKFECYNGQNVIRAENSISSIFPPQICISQLSHPAENIRSLTISVL